MWRAVISSWAIAAVLLLVLVAMSYAPLAWTNDQTLAQTSPTSPTSPTKVAASR